MAGEEQLGKYQVGVALDLRDLVGRVGTVEGILGRLEKGIDSLNEKGEKAGSGWLKGFAQIEIAEKVLHAVHAALDVIPELAHKGLEAFEATVGAAGRYADQLELQAALVGTNIRETQALSTGLEAVGGSGDAATGVLLRVGRAVAIAAGGGGGMRIPPAQAFKELGVELTAAGGRGRPFAEVMDDISRKFAEMPDGPRRTALAIAIFGGEATRMLKLFADLSSEGKTWRQNIDELGLTIDERLLEAAAKLDNQLDILRAQGAATFRLIGAEAAPAFMPLVKELIEGRRQIIEWVKEHKEGIQDVAAVIATKCEQIVKQIEQVVAAFRESGPELEDVIVDAFDLMTVAVTKFVKWTGYAVQGMAGLAAAKDKIFGGGQIGQGAIDLDNYALGLIKAAQAAEQQHEEDVKQTAAFRAKRDQLRATREEIESLAAAQRELPRDVQDNMGLDDRLQAALGRARQQLDALGDEYNKVNEADRKFWEDMGLHERTLPLEKPTPDATQPPIPKFNAQEVEQATNAIQKAIDAADQERAAILGGTQAKIAAIVASREYAAASDAERTALQQKLTDLDALQRALQHATDQLQDFQSQEKQGIANRDRSLALQKEAIQVALAAAKAHHDDQAILTQTAALSAVEAQQRIATEQDAVERIKASLVSLADARSDAARVTVQAAIANGRELAGVGEEQVANLRTQLQDELALRESQLAQVRAIAQAQAAAAQEAAQQEVERLRGALLDLKAVSSSVLDDMFEGGILGTQKMSKAWESMWLSMGRTGLKTLKDMVLNKVTAFDEPMVLNFTELPGKLASAFSPVKGLISRILGDTAKDEVPVGTAGVLAPEPPTPGGADLEGSVRRTLGQPEPAEVPYAPPETEAAESAAAAPGLFRRLFGGLFGGGPPATEPTAGAPGATAPGAVASMNISAGTVFLTGAIGGSGVPAPPGAAPPVGPEAGAPPPPGAAAIPAQPAPAKPAAPSGIENEGPTGIQSAISGLGNIMRGVGSLLMKPLELVPNLLQKGFGDAVHTIASGTKESGTQIAKGAAQTVGGVAKATGELGSFLGGTLQTIGNLIGGGAGKIVSIIGIVISLLSSILVGISASVSIFGTGKGASGGYFTLSGGFERPAGKSADRGTDGAIPFWTHPGEGLINPEATRKLGGRDAIMDLNAGHIPRSIFDRVAASLPADGRIRVAVPAVPRLGNVTSSVIDSSDHRSFTIHPGAIVVQAERGVDVDAIGDAVMRKVVTHFAR